MTDQTFQTAPQLDTTTPEGFRRARQRLGWSGRRAALELGTTQTTVSHWETARHPVCPRAAAALAWRVELEDVRAGEAAARGEVERLRVALEEARAQVRAHEHIETYRRVREERRRSEHERLAQQLRDLMASVGTPNASAPRAWSTEAFRAALELGLVLHVGTTLDDVRAAWRRAASATHPDHGGDAEAFASARAAYETLRAAFA